MTKQSTSDHLIVLELSLLDPAVRGDRQRLSALLADEFTEFGSSGTIYTKHSMISGLLADPHLASEQVQTEDMNVRLLSEDVALLTYRIETEDRSSLRSSIWTVRDDHWQLLFHQGTNQ